MKIREGAYYRTRHGGVVGPMRITNRSQRYAWAFLNDLWTPEGEFAIGEENPFDLISEIYVSDTPPADTPSFIHPMLDGPSGPFLIVPETKTLRDEFAMRLMDRDAFMVCYKEEAEQLYRAADAMMEARKK